MATTRFHGPLRLGDVFPENYAGSNTGTPILAQQVSLTQNSTTAVTATINLPVNVKRGNAQILDVLVDVTTAFDSATSATLTIGTSAGDNTYVSGVNAKTGGRTRPTFSAAQLAASTIATTAKTVYVTITPVGATTAGAVTVTILYVQCWGVDPN